jgi:hypothetical protein
MKKTSLLTVAAVLFSTTALAGDRVFHADAEVYDDVDIRDIEDADEPIDVAFVERSPVGSIEISCWKPDHELECDAYSARDGWLEVTSVELLPYGRYSHELEIEVATSGCSGPSAVTCMEGVISAAPLPSP